LGEKGTEVIEIDLSKIPVKPLGAKEVRELEIALIIGTMLRPDILQEILDPKEFTTWLDSLAVAAGALARDKAGYPISKIAEELGRTEATIRNHLQEKTKAGRLVKETYQMISRGKLKIAAISSATSGDVEELKSRVRELEERLEKVRSTLKELLESL